jgi:hypothetical protein
VIKTITRFTISQFDEIRYVEEIQERVNSPDFEKSLRANFKETDLYTGNFIYNTKEIFFIGIIMIAFFILCSLAYLCCKGKRSYLGRKLRQFTFNSWIRLTI